MRRLPIILGAVVVLIILGLSSIFVVTELQKALVLQFGQVKAVRTEPGLYFKLPLIQDVVYYDGRILPLDTEELEVTPLDERRLVVDAFARWRIDDPVEFRQAVGTQAAGAQRLMGILNASLRAVLGSVPSSAVLSAERSGLMTRIGDEMRQESQGLGVKIVDVRIRRADLPEQNLKATFDRMEAERKREATEVRARGKERAQEVRATADRKAVELVSDAQRQAAIIRGQADAERNRIYAKAFGQDPEFFAFYRSLESYKKALKGNNSTLVLTPDSTFFEYLESPLPDPESADAMSSAPIPSLSLPKEPKIEPGPRAPSDGAPNDGAAAPADEDSAAGNAASIGENEETPGATIEESGEAATGTKAPAEGASTAGEDATDAVPNTTDDGTADTGATDAGAADTGATDAGTSDTGATGTGAASDGTQP